MDRPSLSRRIALPAHRCPHMVVLDLSSCDPRLTPLPPALAFAVVPCATGPLLCATAKTEDTELVSPPVSPAASPEAADWVGLKLAGAGAGAAAEAVASN